MVLTVTAVVAVVFAEIEFSAYDAGGGKVRIIYAQTAATPETMPRGVALKVSFDAGSGATIDSVVNRDAKFNCDLDYLFSNPASYVGDPASHPLANPDARGALTAPAEIASISMGVLDESGTQQPGYIESNNLITLQCSGSGTVNLTIEADTLRGPDSGVVGCNTFHNVPVPSNLSGGETYVIQVTFPAITYGLGDLATMLGTWLDTGCGSANSWCEGSDINTDTEVDYLDFALMAAGWL
jgi:hypothetical protein